MFKKRESKPWELPKWRFKILFYLAKWFNLEIRVTRKQSYKHKSKNLIITFNNSEIL